MTTSPPSGIGRRRAAARDDSSAAYQARRVQIRQAAGELFQRHGFGGTSIGQVAAALDIDRATLYYYIGSKEELFDDVVTEPVRANVLVAEAIQAGDAPAPEKLHDLVTSLMRSYAENHPFLYVYIQENLSRARGTRTAWSEQMRRLNKRYEDALVSIVQSGIDEGTIKPVADAWVIGVGILGMVAWTNRWFDPHRSAVDAEHIGEAYASMVLQGMLVDP